MTSWNSVDELMRDFGLPPMDVAGARMELRARLSKLHPDRSGGAFKSKEAGEEFHRLTDAIAFLDSQSSGLVPVSTVKALTDAFTTTLIQMRQANRLDSKSIEEKTGELLASRRVDISHAFRWPKVSLASVGAALAYVFLFPQHLKDHPYLGPLLKSQRANTYWFWAVGSLGAAWVVVWAVERRQQAWAERLLSFAYQRHKLRELGFREGNLFTRTELRDTLWTPDWYSFRLKKFLRRMFYDLAQAEQAADVALQRYLEKRWIRPVERPAGSDEFDEWYELIRPRNDGE
jgi:hypothetical protein